MLFKLDLILSTILMAVCFICIFIFGPHWLFVGYIILNAAYLLFPKKLVSGSIDIEDQPGWHMALSALIGLGSIFGLIYVQKEKDNIQYNFRTFIAECAEKRRFLVTPYPAYQKAWTLSLYAPEPGNGKGQNPSTLLGAVLSADGTRAVLFYHQASYKNDSGEWVNLETSGDWIAVIDARDGKVIERQKTYFQYPQALAFLPGNRSFLYWEDAFGHEARLSRWTEGQTGSLSSDQAVSEPWHRGNLIALAGDNNRVLHPQTLTYTKELLGSDTILLPPLLGKTGRTASAFAVSNALHVSLPGRTLVTITTIGTNGSFVKSWDLSPSEDELAFGMDHSLAAFKRQAVGWLELRSLPDGKTIRKINIPGKSADWLEYSADGKTIYVFNAWLKILSVIDRGSGKEKARFALYEKGVIPANGISSEGRSALIWSPKTGSVSLYRR